MEIGVNFLVELEQLEQLEEMRSAACGKWVSSSVFQVCHLSFVIGQSGLGARELAPTREKATDALYTMVLNNQVIYVQMSVFGVAQGVGAVGVGTIFEKMERIPGFLDVGGGNSGRVWI